MHVRKIEYDQSRGDRKQYRETSREHTPLRFSERTNSQSKLFVCHGTRDGHLIDPSSATRMMLDNIVRIYRRQRRKPRPELPLVLFVYCSYSEMGGLDAAHGYRAAEMKAKHRLARGRSSTIAASNLCTQSPGP